MVDRSTELLAQDPDPITLKALFEFVDRYTIYKWSRNQINDQEYCDRKYEPKPEPLTNEDGEELL